jgi:nucleoside-diphosphate-sugar epimerase
MTRTALVLGASGGIGGSVARRLLQSGWRVRALVRSEASRTAAGVERVTGDALRSSDVLAAAKGAELIVHGVNPPGYRDWDRLVLPMLENTIAAARAQGARLLPPGTVYNYGPDAFGGLIAENAPQHPQTRKGKIRAEMERRLQGAAEAGEITALVVRAGDFFGPGAGNSWFSQGLVMPGKRPTVIRRPNGRGVGHQWAYLPDVAETMVRLVESGKSAGFATYHMEGHWDGDGEQMTNAIVRTLGNPAVPVKPLPWWALRVMAPFNTTPREMMEMRYLWTNSVRLDNHKLVEHLGAEPRTPLLEAVHTTLEAMGSL